MLYDPETRILFSGDLFGSLSFHQDIMFDERFWDGMKIFHQIYMPSKEALNYAIENARSLQPKPLMIAPQHGGLISGEWVDFVIH